MKKFLGTMIWLGFFQIVLSQPARHLVTGTVTEVNSKTPVSGAVISLGNRQTLSNGEGSFRFLNQPEGKWILTIKSIGFKTVNREVQIGKDAMNLAISLEPVSLFLQPLEVRALRASDKAPFAKTNISQEQLAKTNLGQDIPLLLDQTPSVVVNADAGNGVGYTGIRIRGTDATRINVTLNGIPYNDAESMGTYFVDLPDFASSLSSVQIQRGVGTSSNGAGAFGGTINLATNEYHEKPYAELNNTAGSFNTWKHTLKAGTGLMGGHFTLDARVSRISSDGYIDRASSDLKSFYISTAYLNKKSSLRLNIFSGKEKTYQAWYGVPENLLNTDRTYNPAGTEKPGSPYDNQTDNYTQTHYQLFFNHALSAKWAFNTAVFLTKGKGYYEEYKAGQAFADYGLPDANNGGSPITNTDLVRQRWLDNSFYGQIASLQYKDNRDEFTLGGGWTTYEGSHFGTLAWIQYGSIPPAYRYYDYPALKTDRNVYAKWQHQLQKNWTGFADLQYRSVSHNMNGFEGNPTLTVDRSFHFVNPKLGITYNRNGWQGFLSYAMAHKEPNRDDFQAGITSQPKAETLHDVELGMEKRSPEFQYGATIYYMYYLNQLVQTGQINDVGAYTRINIPYSYRLGIELQAAAHVNRWMQLTGNLTFSKNKVASFVEYLDNYDTGGQDPVTHRNTDISFSPSVIGSATVSLFPVKQLSLNLISKYVGKQYMDNSQSDARKLDGFWVENFRANWTLKNILGGEWQIIGQVNNLFDTKYIPNGYTYNYIYNQTLTTENGYYPMAGRNYLLGVNIHFGK